MTDFALIASQANQWKTAVGSVSSGMSALGVDTMNDELYKMTAALSLVSGLVQMYEAANGIVKMCSTIMAARNAAHALAESSNPVGWGKLALAGAAMATATGVCTYILSCNVLRADLSSPSDRKMIAQTVGAMV